MFISKDIAKNTKTNIYIAPNMKSTCYISWKVLDISSPSIMQNKLKKVIAGLRKRYVFQNTAIPKNPMPIKKGSMFIKCLRRFGHAWLIVLLKYEYLQVCSIYLLIDIQERKQPIPIKSSRVFKGVMFLRIYINEPNIQKKLLIITTIDQ